MPVETNQNIKPELSRLSTETQVKKRVFSGVQPTGNLHIGNYLGAIRNWAAAQAAYDNIFCIVDLHAITVPMDPKELHLSIRQLAALYLACGLDTRYCKLFVQSHVRQHAEMSWIMNCFTPMGWLSRMTQFKSKGGEDVDSVGTGLFCYPVLMACDILLYQTDLVPVGDDQRQHVELTRDIAERFNQRFGETFVVPEVSIPEDGARIKNLQEPERLMSTTRGAPQGVVRLVDPPETIRKKFKTAVTDSGSDVRHDPAEKAGISNLIEIMAVATGDSIPEIESRYEGQGYGEFKEAVGEAVVGLLAPIQERYEELRADEPQLRSMLARGAEKARAASAPTLE